MSVLWTPNSLTQCDAASNIRLCAAYADPVTTCALTLPNIVPPALRRRSATDKLLCNIEAHPNWPLYADVFDHPQKRLVARRPIWTGTTPVDQSVQWEEDWLSAAVVNSHLVCDPTIQQPGFNLPRHFSTLLNRFHTGQGPCHANMHKWGLASSPLCDCGEQQTMEHIVDSCPITILDGGLLSLHEADDDGFSWLKTTAMKALAKWNESCSYCRLSCSVYW